MGNVLRILVRDFRRLIKAPAALIVVGALMVLPSLYTWYNVVAFWDPYNATSGVKVCVVNQDEGTHTEATGELDIGAKLVEQLNENDRLGWVTDRDFETAMHDLKAGDVYAVYVIPEDFSECLVSPINGEVKSPKIQYYANEKLGPVSPKVTDAAASTLEQTINSTFVATVAEVATEAIDEAVKKAESDISAAKVKAAGRADAATEAMSEVRAKLKDVEKSIDDARSKVSSAGDGVAGASKIADDTKAVLKDVTDEAEKLQSSLTKLSQKLDPELSDVRTKLTQVTDKARKLADSIAASTSQAQADVDTAVAKIQPVIDVMRETAADLEAAAAKVKFEPLAEKMRQEAAELKAQADEAQKVLDAVKALAEKASKASQEASEKAKAVDEASDKAVDTLEEYSRILNGKAASAVDSSVAKVSIVCARLTAAVSSMEAAVGQASPILKQLDDVLAQSKTAISRTDGLLGNIQKDVSSVVSDAHLLAQADVVSNLLDNGTLNAKNISEFMGSPTELSTTKLYHPNAYGTAMAPLFMNLSFWIGAFMLVILFLLQVDSEGIPNLKPWQRYLGRFFMFCMFVTVQSLVCCAGTIALGVEVANVPALLVASIASSLAFISIIYMLSSTFRHVGKGLCIVLVFAQIPGASGLYPVEMTSSFFQAIYPFLPFTYGIDALREAICGFYGDFYFHDLLALAAFFVINVTLGLLLGPLVSNVVRMTSTQIHEGDLYNSEEAIIPERPYRLAQVLRTLAEKDSYRQELEERYERFNRRYPIFIRASIVLGVGVPVLIAFLMVLDAAEKVTLLTFFLLWLLALMAFLVAVESQRHSFKRQLNLDGMSEEKLLRIFSNRNHMVNVDAHSGHGNGNGAQGAAGGDVAGEAAGAPGSGAARGGIRNIFLIAHRDLSGMFKNVMCVIMTIGLVALPSLFAWYNILACWNVFDNTSYLSVAVASQDEGYESDLIPINVNVGDKVLSALRENSQINWVFTDADDAVEGVKAGRYYAGLVIPKDFTRDMMTFYEGDAGSAKIDYYVNEKKNAIAPNITGMGADAVSNEVNATFVHTLSQVAVGVAQSLQNAADEGNADTRLADLASHMRTLAKRIDQSSDVLELYADLGKSSQGLVKSGAEIVASARDDVKKASSEIEDGKKRLKSLAGDVADSMDKVEAQLKKAASAVESFEKRAESLVSELAKKVPGISKELREKASELDAKAATLSEIVAELEKLRDELKSGMQQRVDAVIDDGKANVKADLGGGKTYQSEVSLRVDIDAITSSIEALEQAKAALTGSPVDQAKIDEIDAALTELKETRAKLKELLDSRVDIDVQVELGAEAEVMVENTVIIDKDIAALKKAIEILNKASAACTKAADALDTGTADVEKQIKALNAAVDKVKKDVEAAKKDLKKDLQPGANKLKADIDTLVSDLSKASNKMKALDPDLAGTLKSVASSLGEAASKTDDAGKKLHDVSKRVRSLADAVDEARYSGTVDKLRSILANSSERLATAMTAPVEVERTALFPSDNFGSSMAPLYCTLALFIGSLLIMVAMRPEVSRRGREELVNPKPRHLFFGRFVAVATLSLMQTTLLGLGNLFFLKVQVADPLLFMLGFWFSGLVLAFMIYALVAAFGNLGKALAVLLLIVQVTACGGSYPLQMLPDFVQAISPWVPATYIVDILQSAMFGVYLNDYWVAMGYLALYIIPFLLLGLVLRKPMERFMKFYVSKVEECGIMG